MMVVSAKETFEFLDVLFRNKLTEAEKYLTQLEEKHPDDTRYIHALKGLYHSYVGEDRDSLLYMLFLNEEYRRRKGDVKRSMEGLSQILGKEDRFFHAWRHVIEAVDKLPKPAKITATQEG
ncbi:MAG: hypothetical protein QXX43_00255 [Candidatus Caldarchaeum sp.]